MSKLRAIAALTVVFWFIGASNALAMPAPPSGPPATPTTPSAPTNIPPDLPVESLAGTDPSCLNTAVLSAIAAQNCALSGNPESAFPPSNYGTDVNISTGVTEPTSDFDSILSNLVGLLFQAIADFMSTVFTALGLAFSFDLFSSDHGGKIPTALLHAEQFFTFPFLPLALIIGGLWGLKRWIAERNESAAISHWLVMSVMMLAGLLIIQDSTGIFGTLDKGINDMASSIFSVFANQSTGQTGDTYASAEPGLWKVTIEEPWCALEFGNVAWCMQSPDATTNGWRTTTLAHLTGGNGLPSAAICDKPLIAYPNPAQACAQRPELTRLQAANTNGEMWLAFPAGDDARNGATDSWTLYHQLSQQAAPLTTIRTASDVGDRLADFLLVGLGVIFFVMLLIWIALNMLIAAILFVVLLLMAPIIILAPAFGSTGQQKAQEWGGWLLGSLVVKLIFAAALGILVFTSSVLIAVGQQQGGWLESFILFAVFWAGAFLGRKALMSHFGWHRDHTNHVGAVIAGASAIGVARRLGKGRPKRVFVKSPEKPQYENPPMSGASEPERQPGEHWHYREPNYRWGSQLEEQTSYRAHPSRGVSERSSYRSDPFEGDVIDSSKAKELPPPDVS